MKFRVFALLAALALVAPTGVRGDDWGYGSYDVSVDLGGAVSIDTFHRPLARYGDWMELAGYGQVWRPRVAVGWRPYYYGRWEWTNEGWFWVSDEPWGWAAYHYGRWAYDGYAGWVWVPGYEWAPAWVSWRVSGDVIGWAPLAPGLSVYVTTYPFVDFWWTFVPTVRFVSVPVYTAAYAPSYARRWWNHTQPAPARPAPRPGVRPAPAPRSALAWGGPAPRLVEERAGRPVRPVRVVPAPAPGAHRARPGEVSVFRPERRAAPARGEPGRGRVGSPMPGQGRESAVPPPQGGGRRSAPAPTPGWTPPAREGRSAARADDRGDQGRAVPPAWRGEGRSDARPQPAPAQGRGNGRGGERREEGRAAPAPRR